MTLTDAIILIIVLAIVFSIVYVKFKNRKQSSCAVCAYAPKKIRK